jgi:hypothetical protein
LATSERYEADLDSFLEICTPALSYLTFQDFQPVFLENGGIEVLQLALLQLYSRFDLENLNPDTASQLKQVGDAFLAVFADISALPGFLTSCPLDSNAVLTLVNWLKLPLALSQLQTAACLALGNLSRSDESSIALLKHVQSPLLEILECAIPGASSHPAHPSPGSPTLQLVHAALSFLKNLAIPPANKTILGKTALLQPPDAILPRLWTSTRTQPQLQFAAVSLTRLLLTNCPNNIRWICQPTPPRSEHASNLALLVSVAASADEEPIKLEAARAVSQVCRALHANTTSSMSPASTVLDPTWEWTTLPPTASSETDSPVNTATITTAHHEDPTATPTETAQPESSSSVPVLARFLRAHAAEITSSFRRLLTHPRFPTLRSDAIFVLALMSRGPSSSSPLDHADGARLALETLQQQPQQPDSGHGKDKPTAAAVAAWVALASAITGSSDGIDEFAAALAESVTHSGSPGTIAGGQRDNDVTDDDDDDDDDDAGAEGRGTDKKESGAEEEVTVERLSLEPRQEVIDPQGLGQRQQQQQQPARAAAMDRENAMVLVAELLRRFPDELSGLRRPLDAILTKGGELVVRDRQQEG